MARVDPRGGVHAYVLIQGASSPLTKGVYSLSGSFLMEKWRSINLLQWAKNLTDNSVYNDVLYFSKLGSSNSL